MDNTVGSLSQMQRSVIIGSLLGDGYLRIISGRRNAFLEINHSIKQKDYVDWKYAILKNEKNIDKSQIHEFCENTITFLRIAPSFCQDGVNYGRNFMEKYNIKKTGVQNNNHKEFYS